MIAYKFLAAGGVGPFTQVAWPPPGEDGAPGAWLAAAGPLAQRGVHVCGADQLACWLHDELWQVEIAGAQLAGLDCVIAQRGRLIRRIAGWDAAGAARFARACLAHARAQVGDVPLLADGDGAADAGYIAVAAHCAAVALSATGGEPAFAAARAWQSAWIARELVGAL